MPTSPRWITSPRLSLGGSRELTDDGLLHLARMPQLEYLNLSEYPRRQAHRSRARSSAPPAQPPHIRNDLAGGHHRCGRRSSANLRSARKRRPDGFAHRRWRHRRAQGKPHLRNFSTGKLVTDAGLPLLHNFPLLKNGTERQRPAQGRQCASDRRPIHQPGTRQSGRPRGCRGPRPFWHVSGITTDAFAHLVQLPNLAILGLRRPSQRRHRNAPYRRDTAPAQAARAGIGRHRRWLRRAEPFPDLGRVLGPRVPQLRQPRLCRLFEDARAAQSRRGLQECGRPGALHAASLSRPSGIDARSA